MRETSFNNPWIVQFKGYFVLFVSVVCKTPSINLQKYLFKHIL